MSLSLQEVQKIAELSRLKLTPDEEKRYAETISAVLDYMTILNEVDTAGVEPTAQVTGLHNVTRSDEVVVSPFRGKLMATMPRVTAEELPVPGVFE